jgi:uncharacterized damage-inducible protein DinB
VTIVDEFGRPMPPEAGDEVATLVGFLEFQRSTLAWKCAGLDASGLGTRVAKSEMTLGGILKHMAYVEELWFGRCLDGRPKASPWNAVDWDADPDWEWHSAAEDSPAALREIWQQAVETSRGILDHALAAGGLDQLGSKLWEGEDPPSLRWILVHMIEEYARHNGHADLIREAVDGETGE